MPPATRPESAEGVHPAPLAAMSGEQIEGARPELIETAFSPVNLDGGRPMTDAGRGARGGHPTEIDPRLSLPAAAAQPAAQFRAESAEPRVLVIRRRYLGDVVLLAPVLRNLRLHWPRTRIAVLVEAAYAPVLTLNPDVDEILSLPHRWTEWAGFLARLRRARYTHVFDLDNNERTALVTRLTGAPFRAALWHETLRWRSCYTTDVFHPPEIHERTSIVDYCLAILASAAVPIVTREVRLVLRPADVVAAQKLVRPGGRKLLVHPGSRSSWRIWPAENFAAVCDRVQNELDVQVFVTGGPGDQAVVGEIRRRAQTHLIALDGPLSLPQFAALAAQFDVMLCHDSGPMHLAAAVGTSVVALFGSQNSVLFAPAGSGNILLQPPLPCTACIAPEKCIPADSYHNLCVRRIGEETVFAALRQRLTAKS